VQFFELIWTEWRDIELTRQWTQPPKTSLQRSWCCACFCLPTSWSPFKSTYLIIHSKWIDVCCSLHPLVGAQEMFQSSQIRSFSFWFLSYMKYFRILNFYGGSLNTKYWTSKTHTHSHTHTHTHTHEGWHTASTVSFLFKLKQFRRGISIFWNLDASFPLIDVERGLLNFICTAPTNKDCESQEEGSLLPANHEIVSLKRKGLYSLLITRLWVSRERVFTSC